MTPCGDALMSPPARHREVDSCGFQGNDWTTVHWIGMSFCTDITPEL